MDLTHNITRYFNLRFVIRPPCISRTSRLFEELGIFPAAAAASAGGGFSSGRRQNGQNGLNGEQVQKLLSFRRFVRTAGLGPRQFVARVRNQLAIEASQTFDEDGVTTRRDNARKR